MKNKNNRKIFFFNKDGERETVMRFHADDDDGAYEVLLKYKSEHPEENGVEYYYGSSGGIFDPDGTEHDTLETAINSGKHRAILESICDFCMFLPRLIYGFFKTVWTRICDVAYYAWYGHPRNKWYSIDTHILSELKHNVMLLRDRKNSVPVEMYDQVDNEAKKEGKTISVEERDRLAASRWDDELTGFVTDILLYEYYMDFGIVDDDDMDMLYIQEHYGDSLPYKRGTYDEFDYVKLSELTQKQWTKICRWFERYGQNLWD